MNQQQQPRLFTRYIMVDRSGGQCAAAVRREWGPLMAGMMDGDAIMDGDAFVIRNSLIEQGFKFGEDFYIKRVQAPFGATRLSELLAESATADPRSAPEAGGGA